MASNRLIHARGPAAHATAQYIAGAGALVAAAALALAYASQYWGGLAPCELCLWQRWPYWAAVAAGLAALVLPRAAGLLAVVIALLFLGNAVLAGFHAGVEWRFWASPFSGCGAGAGLGARSVEDLMASIAAAPIVRCEDAAFRFAGLSMAGWNAVFALCVGAILLMWMRQSRRT